MRSVTNVYEVGWCLPMLVSLSNSGGTGYTMDPVLGILRRVETMVPSPQRSEVGTITTVNSTMFGGKSSHALHHMETMSVFHRRKFGDSKKILYINHSNDTRPPARAEDGRLVNPLARSHPFSTHSKIITPDALEHVGADHLKISRLSDLSDEVAKKYAEIVIDEAQFFPDLLERCLYLAESLGINIYALGLTLDYKRKKFGELGDLALYADVSIKLKDTCCFDCADRGEKNVALFNRRDDDTTGRQIEVGNNYSAVCRRCYLDTA